MGSDDSFHTSKRSIANISRSLRSAGRAPPMRSKLVTKFLVLLTTITLLVYVLADQVPLSQQDVSSQKIHSAERPPVSVPSSATSVTVRKDLGGDEGEENSEVSEKRKEWVNRNIEKICNHSVVGWADKTQMHDILTYISALNNPITYLDIGANVGGTSLPATICFKPEHRVIAIEPIKVNFQAIAQSLAGISIKPVGEDRFLAANIGFSDETKKTRMFIPGGRGDNAALDEKASKTVFKDGMRQEEVEVYRGDEFLKMHKAEPKLIKIDVQGSEIRVVRGMEEYLKKHKNVLMMAEHDDRLIRNSGFGIYDVYDFMKGVGFKVYHKPEVGVMKGEFWVKSDEIDREKVTKIRGDLVYWKSGSA